MKTQILMCLCPKHSYVTGCCNSCKNVVLQSQCKKKISMKKISMC